MGVLCNDHGLSKNLVCIESGCIKPKLMCDTCLYENHIDHKTIHVRKFLEHLNSLNTESLLKEEKITKEFLDDSADQIKQIASKIKIEISEMEESLEQFKRQIDKVELPKTDTMNLLSAEIKDLMGYYSALDDGECYLMLVNKDIDRISELIEDILKNKLIITNSKEKPKIMPYLTTIRSKFQGDLRKFTQIQKGLSNNCKQYLERMKKICVNLPLNENEIKLGASFVCNKNVDNLESTPLKSLDLNISENNKSKINNKSKKNDVKKSGKKIPFKENGSVHNQEVTTVKANIRRNNTQNETSRLKRKSVENNRSIFGDRVNKKICLDSNNPIMNSLKLE
jgi:hypothetical protein